MLQYLERMADLFGVVIDFVIDFVNNLIFLIKLIPTSIFAVSSVVSLMPPFFTVPLFAFLGVSLVIAFLNKWG